MILRTPIDDFLEQQADLSAVERFSQQHVHTDSGTYKDLLPATPPGPGQQYAFEVDLDTCTGCKACVTACHSLNGLDEDESWRRVGSLHGETTLQSITHSCHHCVDPACLSGCPVNAYDKDPITGIVKHLDDQCIGCGYCTFTCPYEVPLYNESKGIVRKCDMCAGRLETGEAPACVQACPNGAIKITLVDVASVTRKGSLVPGAPSSAITAPTTVYKTTHAEPSMTAADHYALRPGHAHPPLALMLVLTQLSVGAFIADLVFGRSNQRPVNATVALVMGVLALGASIFHLGRPLYAFRAVLGIRRSWLSREIVAFGGFAGLAAAYAGSLWLGLPFAGPLGVLVALAGVAGVACSAMVYAVTQRAWWRLRVTGPKFVLTALVCGLATMVASSAAQGTVADTVPLALMAATAAKLAWEGAFLGHRLSRTASDLQRTSVLLTRDLVNGTRARFALGLFGGVIAPLVVLGNSGMVRFVASLVGVALVLAGELVERSQFFRAVVAPRMPGVHA